MTLVKFFESNGNITGFSMCGHSTESEKDEEGRLVCSAVSSAAYMASNTLTEIIGADADISVDENNGTMSVILKSRILQSQDILNGFKLHLKQLSASYNENIQIITEV